VVLKITFKQAFPLGDQYHGLIDIKAGQIADVDEKVGNLLLAKFPANFFKAEKAIDGAGKDKMEHGSGKNK
jgi:hypothetical protein